MYYIILYNLVKHIIEFHKQGTLYNAIAFYTSIELNYMNTASTTGSKMHDSNPRRDKLGKTHTVNI